MRSKVVLMTLLVALLVGWGLGGMLLGGLVLLEKHQAAQYQIAALTYKGTCHAGNVDACDQELAAQFKSGQSTLQADWYGLFLFWWVGLTLLVGAPVAGVSLRQWWQAQQSPRFWSST
jgi:hypothetical protein